MSDKSPNPFEIARRIGPSLSEFTRASNEPHLPSYVDTPAIPATAGYHKVPARFGSVEPQTYAPPLVNDSENDSSGPGEQEPTSS